MKRGEVELGISQWSFHRAILGNVRNNYDDYFALLHSDPEKLLIGEMDSRDIIQVANKLNVPVVDVVNVLFFSRRKDLNWLKNWSDYAESKNVRFNCLMCDESGHLGSSSSRERALAIDKHLEWLMAAKELGCQQFRVNTYGDGSYLEQLNSSAKSLRVLADEAAELNIEVLVENHGHPSSNGAWLAMLIDSVERSNVGVYLDLDNFFMGGWEHCPKRYYDRRQGIEDLSPFTRAVSAKSYRFDDHGLETTVNYRQSFELLSKSGFSGVISAEYEGEFHSEMEGTEATLNLIRQSISHLADN